MYFIVFSKNDLSLALSVFRKEIIPGKGGFFMISVGIVGGSGYTGEKIAKLLESHKGAKVKMICSQTSAGKKVNEVLPELKTDLVFSSIDISKLNQMDCVFLAVPHGAAKEIASKLTCKVIDLTADHRSTHTYGLPEVYSNEIKKATLVANPGCYATACLLASLPVKDQIDSVVFDCISGYSGGGKTSKYDFEENIIAYSLVNHFHKNEIQDKLGMKISFTPHVVNAFNGLMCTAHIALKEGMSKEVLFEKYSSLYKDTLTQVSETIPCTKEVLNSPFCKISFEVNGLELVVVSVLDNLMKGAASQAIQNMNLLFGFNQTEGLV